MDESLETNGSLLIQIRDTRNGEAWRTFVKLYSPVIHRYCRRRGLQDADARDVVQEVLARVSQSIGNFNYDPARGRFRNWIGTITSHAIGRQIKKVKRPDQSIGGGLDEPLLTSADAEMDEVWAEEFHVELCRTALARIRSHFNQEIWQAFEMTWLRAMKPDEAAVRLEKPASWVYKARHKVLSRLKDEIALLSADELLLHRTYWRKL